MSNVTDPLRHGAGRLRPLGDEAREAVLGDPPRGPDTGDLLARFTQT
jgi:hypothetical protein